MEGTPTYFNQALSNLIAGIANLHFPDAVEPIVVRDHYGRIRLAIDADAKTASEIESMTSSLWMTLGVYSDPKEKRVLGRDDFFAPDLVFKNPDTVTYVEAGHNRKIKLLDRQVTGQDWIRTVVREGSHPPRVVFYGLKGGVGRSTALALYAYHLGFSGKRVLLIDFDLESPGLSSLMLPPDKLPEFGIVDWFIEDAVGQADSLSERMTSISPLSNMQGVTGRIMVAAAMQVDESAYLSKLSRVFIDIPKSIGGVERFYERSGRLLHKLEDLTTPDVVLIDSRAGLHDIAAVSVMGLADTVLLFGTDSLQTWETLRLLFTHWQTRPEILKTVRDRLKMVYALFPENDQERRKKSYLEHSYNLFSSTIYEEIPASEKNSSPDAFNFDMNSIEAPHYPSVINWNSRFLEFSEENLFDQTITRAMIEGSFGAFFETLNRILEERTA
jgi:cellulose biosynthesis protein BcsQ